MLSCSRRTSVKTHQNVIKARQIDSKDPLLFAQNKQMFKATHSTLATFSSSSAASVAATTSPLFSAALYFSHLRNKTSGPGRELWFAPALDSTQTHLISSGVDGDAGIVCVAARQTAGKGRGDNTWESPEGCLMFSFRQSFPDREGKTLPFMQYVISLAMVRAVRKCAYIDIKIKWPNDLYSAETPARKIGGILCQSHYQDSRFVVTTGVGLNVSNDKPTTCISALANRTVSQEALLGEFFNAFDDLYNGVFLPSGPSFAPLLDEYHSNWLHSGQVVTADDGKVQAVVQGISPVTGCLLARDATGLLELQPDGNRLDFFKGLISRRV